MLQEFCGLISTLIVDEDRRYDPRYPNDRLLLGSEGTVGEKELSLLVIAPMRRCAKTCAGANSSCRSPSAICALSAAVEDQIEADGAESVLERASAADHIRVSGQLSSGDDGSGEVSDCSVAGICLVVTRCDTEELLCPRAIDLVETPPCIDCLVEDKLHDPIGFWRSDRRCTALACFSPAILHG